MPELPRNPVLHRIASLCPVSRGPILKKAPFPHIVTPEPRKKMKEKKRVSIHEIAKEK